MDESNLSQSLQNMNTLLWDILPVMLPPENLTVSEWSVLYRILDNMSSRHIGLWRHNLTPHLIEPMDAMSPNSKYNHVILMFGSQLGKTEAIINAILTFMDIDPCPIIFYLPTADQAKQYSKKRIAPAITNSTRLAKSIIEDTIMNKLIPGGSLMMSGANSPTNMAGYPARVIARDEIDRWPDDVSEEGSGLDLTEQRAATYEDDKMIIDTSTPTIKDQSAIEKQFNNSDQRHRYVPCPHCGEYQELLWKRKLDDNSEKETFMIDFERNSAGTVTNANFLCVKCGEFIEEKEKPSMCNKGKYIAHNPGHHKAGFFCNGLNSLFMSWIEVGNRWFDAQGDYTKLKTFVNVVLCQTWSDPSQYVRDDVLIKRAEDYIKVPEEVIILVAGIDIQRDRIEIEIRGYGYRFENWGIEYHIIHGDYDEAGTWLELAQYLFEECIFEREDGKLQTVLRTFIDSADGVSNPYVYEFCKEYKNYYKGEKTKNKIFPIHGYEKAGMDLKMIHKTSKVKDYNITLVTLGTNTIKDAVLHCLNNYEKGINYAHFPNGAGYDENYFKMLTAEEKKIEKKKNGKEIRSWVQVRERNESFDCFCYTRAAIESCKPNWERWKKPRGIISTVKNNLPTPENKGSNGIVP